MAKGRTSPSHSLQEAVSFLERVYENLGEGPFDREMIAQALGHQSTSGPALTKIGTLTHFGLAEITDGSYWVSLLGKRVLFPRTDDERQQAYAEAAIEPSLYAELFERLDGQPVPTLLANILTREFGVSSKTSKRVADTFRETAEFAGLLRNGILLQEVHALVPHKESEAVQVARPTEETQQLQSGHCEQCQEFAIPISKGRVSVLALPTPVEQSDLDRIVSWIDLMADVLTGETDDEARTESSFRG